jgi:hypothetical protein
VACCGIVDENNTFRLRSRLSSNATASRILSFYSLFILNCGFVAGFLRLNAYSFADPFLFPFRSLCLVLAFYLPVAASVSLPTELRLRNRLLSTECIWLR